MKKIEDKEDLSGKRVLLRLDLNVPLQDGEIQDETRINKIIPTLKFLLKKKIKNYNCFSHWKTKRKSCLHFVYEASL